MANYCVLQISIQNNNSVTFNIESHQNHGTLTHPKGKVETQSWNKITVKVKDVEGNKVAEYLLICIAEDPLEYAINQILQTLTIERKYHLHTKGKTNFLVHSIGRALEGGVMDKFNKAKQGNRLGSKFGHKQNRRSPQRSKGIPRTCKMPQRHDFWELHWTDCAHQQVLPSLQSWCNKYDYSNWDLIKKLLLAIFLSNLNQIYFQRRRLRNRFGQGQESHQNLHTGSCTLKGIWWI